jgi:hypothetical protein
MRSTARRAAAAAILGVCLGAGVASADDRLELKNGARVEGVVVEDDGETVVLERSSGGGKTRMSIPWSQIFQLQRDAKPPAAAATVVSSAAVRDEWWLLRAGGKIVGTRHLLLGRLGGPGCEKGWRLEETVTLFASSPRSPAVHVQRIEEVNALFLPRALYYRETGEGAPEFGIEPYEVIRSGPVRDGAWHANERAKGQEGAPDERVVRVPEGARGPLGTREWLLRAPRAVGLHDVSMVDPREAAVRTVRVGFTALGPGEEDVREDVLRIEDGELVLEGRCTGTGCREEDVAPGVVAVLSNEAQAEAAANPTGVGSTTREVTLPECGVAMRLPGASWSVEIPPSTGATEGRRVVARLSSDLHVADVRVEWDPAGTRREPFPSLAPESALLARLRGVSRDVAVIEARGPVDGVAGAWRVGLSGTVRQERVRTLALVAERGDGRVTLLASCQEAAWPDAKAALEAIVSSFRWL